MLKAMIEKKIGQHVSDEVFKEIMEETTRDIRYNRLVFGIRTNLEYVLNAAATYYRVCMRCA